MSCAQEVRIGAERKTDWRCLLFTSLSAMNYLRAIAASFTSSSAPAVVVAGLGRCGTWSMTEAAGRYLDEWYHNIRPEERNFPYSAVYYYMGKIDPENMPRIFSPVRPAMAAFGHIPAALCGRVYKTHAYPFPDQPLPPHVRVLWMFGNPLNIVASIADIFAGDLTQRERFYEDHYRNLESPHYAHRAEILTRDTLMLERQFDAWYRPHAFRFLSLRYEAMYRPAVWRTVENFLGLPLPLLPQKERRANWSSHPRSAQMMATYGRLHEKIEAAEDVKIWPAAPLRPQWRED